MIDELAKRLDLAKETYTRQVQQIDRALRPIVAANPALLDDVKALQSSYAVSPECEPVAPLEQGGVTVSGLMQKAEDEREGHKAKAHSGKGRK